MKIDPKYGFLHAFFLISPPCPLQNLLIWPKAQPFFYSFACFCTPKWCTCVYYLVLKTTLFTWFFLRGMISSFKYKWPPGFVQLIRLFVSQSGGGGGHSTVFLVGMSCAKCGNVGLKNWFFTKVSSKELKIFNSLRAYKLKFEPDLGCRAENSSICWQISLVGIKIWYFCSKWGSKKLNHAVTGDLKNGGRGVKSGFWPLNIPIPPFQVSAPPPGLTRLITSEIIEMGLFRMQ